MFSWCGSDSKRLKILTCGRTSAVFSIPYLQGRPAYYVKDITSTHHHPKYNIPVKMCLGSLECVSYTIVEQRCIRVRVEGMKYMRYKVLSLIVRILSSGRPPTHTDYRDVIHK